MFYGFEVVSFSIVTVCSIVTDSGELFGFVDEEFSFELEDVSLDKGL